MKDTLLQGTLATSTVLIGSAFGALILGNLWVALGWMRFYGMEPGVVASAIPLDAVNYNNSFLNEVGKLIDSYNLYFQGNARFGSGIGLMAGGCLALLGLTRNALEVRTVAAAMAGALVAGRFCLTFTSAPTPFLISVAIGAIVLAAVQLATHETLPTLPCQKSGKVKSKDIPV